MLKADLWFPSIVWCGKLEVDLAWLKNHADNLRKADPKGHSVSNHGGWQSKSIESWDKTPEELMYFRSVLDREVKDCVKQAGLPMLQMSNLWFNINGYKDYNNLHDHQNSILSGAFYIDVEEPDLMGNIEFHREDAAIHFLPPLDKYNHFTSQKASYRPEAGLLLLFPSWLKHNVVGNLSQKERYSLSFNFTPRQQPVMQDGQQN